MEERMTSKQKTQKGYVKPITIKNDKLAKQMNSQFSKYYPKSNWEKGGL